MGIYFNGYQTPPGGKREVAITNPATGETLKKLPLADNGDGKRILDVAGMGFDSGLPFPFPTGQTY